jgi:hypothetical protein
MNDFARAKLFTLVTTYGRTVCNTPRTCEIFLQQQFEEYPAERQLLVEALRLGIVARLLEPTDGLPYVAVAAPLIRELVEGANASAENARWAVDSWALALGKHPDTAPPPPAPPVEEAEEEPALSAMANSKIWPLLIVGLGGSLGAILATVIFTFLIYTLVSSPHVIAGRAGAIALVVGLVLAVTGGIGGAIGGAGGWLLIQVQTVPTPRSAEVAHWRLVRGFLHTLAGAAGATLLGGWFVGLLGIALGALLGGFSAAVVSGLKG